MAIKIETRGDVLRRTGKVMVTAAGMTAVMSFTIGMPLASKLEHLMLFFILPALLVFLLFSTLRAWRRQH